MWEETGENGRPLGRPNKPKICRLGAGLCETDYPEAEATVPIHPETPTSGHTYLCILLAKGAITGKSNKQSHL